MTVLTTYNKSQIPHQGYKTKGASKSFHESTPSYFSILHNQNHVIIKPQTIFFVAHIQWKWEWEPLHKY